MPPRLVRGIPEITFEGLQHANLAEVQDYFREFNLSVITLPSPSYAIPGRDIYLGLIFLI